MVAFASGIPRAGAGVQLERWRCNDALDIELSRCAARWVVRLRASVECAHCEGFMGVRESGTGGAWMFALGRRPVGADCSRWYVVVA